MHAYFYAFM